MSLHYIPENSDEMDPNTPAGKTASLLLVATLFSVMFLIGIIALLQTCKRRRVRDIVFQNTSTTTLPMYQDQDDIPPPPPAYFPLDARQYRECTRTSGETDTIPMKSLS